MFPGMIEFPYVDTVSTEKLTTLSPSFTLYNTASGKLDSSTKRSE